MANKRTCIAATNEMLRTRNCAYFFSKKNLGTINPE
jgi:hypothetical protein